MMATFCRRCRAPMRSRSRTTHVRCELDPVLADEIYALLRGVCDGDCWHSYAEEAEPDDDDVTFEDDHQPGDDGQERR